MKVLITGAAGFIGSNLVNHCISLGWDVTGVDNLSNGHLEFIPNLKKIILDDFASENVLSLVQAKSFDVVFHLAAIPRVSYSVEFPIETHETNVNKTLKLIDACRGNIARFVFASSSSVYGGAINLPASESEIKNPKSPYALQKSIIEDYLKVYYDLYRLDSISLRFFNVFGPNQLGDSPYSTAVSAWLTSIKNNSPMRSDGDGTQSRDMCYVDNVVDACIRSGMYSGSLKGECYNVACGDRTENREILIYLKNKFPESSSYSAPWRPGDVMHTQANINSIYTKLGYVPIVRFWQGLDLTIEWYNHNWHWIKNLRLSK